MKIIPLAFASAGSLAIQLLAVVLVILTRPRPKPLLWAFWLSALVVSCGFGFVALALFRAKGTFLGTMSRNVSPAIYLIVGAVAVCVAVFAATRRGRELIGREIDKRQSSTSTSSDSQGSLSERAQVKVQDVKAKAEEALRRGSVWVALAVGLVLGAPTPFQLAAIGSWSGTDTACWRSPCSLSRLVSLLTWWWKFRSSATRSGLTPPRVRSRHFLSGLAVTRFRLQLQLRPLSVWC